MNFKGQRFEYEAIKKVGLKLLWWWWSGCGPDRSGNPFLPHLSLFDKLKMTNGVKKIGTDSGNCPPKNKILVQIQIIEWFCVVKPIC